MKKRIFDIIFSFLGLIFLFVLLLPIWLIAVFDTKSNGIFSQKRIGQYGNLFIIIKFRTIHVKNNTISPVGLKIRKLKLDELPQLLNILRGDMSFVGPRPDVKGFADELNGEDRIILNIKPGLTGPATLYYKNEEQILANQTNPSEYNKNVIWPQKVKLNKRYVKNNSIFGDIHIILKTLF